METNSTVEIASMAESNRSFHPVRENSELLYQPVTDNFFSDVKVFTMGELKDEELLGQGGFGVVYRRRWQRSPTECIDVAEKKMLSDHALGIEAQRGLKKEVEILKNLDHPYIVSLLGMLIGEDERSCSLIIEYAPYGSCTNFFERLSEKKVGDELKRPFKYQIAMQVSDAMAYLHRNKVLHLDLKSNNVLIGHHLVVKLCDFGLSYFDHLNRLTSTSARLSYQESRSGRPSRETRIGGTVTHMPPERLADVNKAPDRKTDVYSFGIFLWELMAEDAPYKYALNEAVITESVKNGQRPDSKSIPSSAPKLLKSIMIRSYVHESIDRPEFEEIRSELSQNPHHTADEIEHAVAKILSKLNQTHSDSTIILSPQKRDPHLCTQSEGKSRPGPFPDPPFNSFTDVETAPKEPCSSKFSDTDNQNHLVTASFEPEPIVSHEQRATSDVHQSSVPTSTDIQESDTLQDANDDQRPLVGAEPSTSVSQSKGKKIIYVVLAILALIVIGVIVGVVVCHFQGCFASCPVLRAGDHEQIKCTPPQSGSTQAHSGDVCTFSCDYGYGIKNENDTLTCQKNGSWSSKSTPKCSELQSCSPLVKPANGGDFDCTNEFFEMSVCQFMCPTSYCLHLPGSASCVNSSQIETTCNIAKTSSVKPTWSSPVVPYCENVTTCSDLPTPISGKYQCDKQALNLSSDENIQTNGTICSLQCEPHFGAKSPSAVFCQKNGTWNTTTFPTCILQCSTNNFSINGSYSCNHDLFVNSVCTFTCKENFVLVGPETLTCMNDGAWKEKLPTCVCPACSGGRNCNQSLTWNATLQNMHQSYMKPKGQFNYDDHSVSCYNQKFYDGTVGMKMKASRGYSFSKSGSSGNFSCVCKDVHTNMMKQCNNLPTLEDACDATLSTFLRLMAYKGLYRLPCDANIMTPPCDGSSETFASKLVV